MSSGASQSEHDLSDAVRNIYFQDPRQQICKRVLAAHALEEFTIVTVDRE